MGLSRWIAFGNGLKPGQWSLDSVVANLYRGRISVAVGDYVSIALCSSFVKQ